MGSIPSQFMVNQQGVFGLSRSWFYLTLWRGTPAEFTEIIDVDIQQANPAQAIIAMADAVEAGVERITAAATDVVDMSVFNTVINTETAVVWYVG